MEQQNFEFFGHSYEDYLVMFNLSERELNRRILDCAAGMSDFTARTAHDNHDVVAIDPMYNQDHYQLEQTMLKMQTHALEWAEKHQEDMNWLEKPADEAHRRMNTAKQFLADYDMGVRAHRYMPEALPTLSFEDQAFDMVLCSHFLFTHSDVLSEEFHIKAIMEMMRVANEIRIFPITEKTGVVSRHLTVVLQAIQQRGYCQSMEKVDYALQKSGDAMLHIYSEACEIEAHVNAEH